jgi:dienelactone hydrolase
MLALVERLGYLVCAMRILMTLLLAGSLPASADSRTAFLKLIDRPRVPLAAQESAATPAKGFAQIHFSFAAEAGQRVPGILIRAEGSGGKRPTVIALHGTGGNKESQLALLQSLARKGFTAVAIDGRYHGERSKAGKGSEEYQEAMYRTWKTGKELPFLYDTAWDVMRLIDYLETRADVDPKRIGAIGFSKGGMEAYLAAAVDPRIAATVPCIGVQSFRWAIENNSWHSRVGTFQSAIDRAAKETGSAVDAAFVRKFYDKVVPGVYGEFDGPAMVPLIAPRPLLMINGDEDPRTPMPGVKEAAANAREAYAKAGAGDRFELHIQEKTGHQVRPAAVEVAVAFFEKWLKP